MSAGIQSLERLVQFYADHQVEKIYVKILAPNDNTKNQVYLGPGFEALTLFPIGEISPDPSSKNPIFKATMDFLWVGDDTSLVAAPTAQVILYPQYPEIRFSGFLKGAARLRLDSIRALMASRTPNRILFLGVTPSRKVIAAVFDPNSAVAAEFNAIAGRLGKAASILFEIIVTVFLGGGPNPRQKLLEELCRIHRLDWIDSKRLDGNGNVIDCNAPQCGGYTLEAELGIRPNGNAEPDFMGWEVKQHSGSVLTLMTPEPTGGFYKEHGVEDFVRTFGYDDQRGRVDRMNFGGVHLCNVRHARTNLTMQLLGYDSSKKKIIDQNGGIALVSPSCTLAAFWDFKGLLKHWNRKHNNAVYVPSNHRKTPANQYKYADKVLLGVGTDPLKLLVALDEGKVYYDPGIKLENASTANPSTKRRSQFRVNLKNIESLYDAVTQEDVTSYCTK